MHASVDGFVSACAPCAAPPWHVSQLRMSCGYVAEMPWNRFAAATFSPLWIRWTKLAESASGFVVRPGLWQVLHIAASIRPPPWNAADDVVSALNLSWQLLHPACDTISRRTGVPVPLGM